MTSVTMPTGVHPTLTYTHPILSVGHTYLSRSNVPPPISNIPIPIPTNTMATKQVTSIPSLSSNQTLTTSIVCSSEKDPISTVITIPTTEAVPLMTTTSSITTTSSNRMSLDNLWKTAAVNSQSTIAAVTSQPTITVPTICTVTTLSPTVSSSMPLSLDKGAAVTSQTSTITTPTSISIQQKDRLSVITTSSNVVEIPSTHSERVPDLSKPADTSVIIPLKLDDLWKSSPHVIPSQGTPVTCSVPPHSLSSTLLLSTLEARVSDKNDDWERERERKLQLRQEQEHIEQEKIHQELAKLQEEQNDKDNPVYNKDSNHDPSHPGSGGTVEDKTVDHEGTNLSIQHYLASVQRQSPPLASLQYKEPSTPSDQVSTYYRRHYKGRFEMRPLLRY